MEQSPPQQPRVGMRAETSRGRAGVYWCMRTLPRRGGGVGGGTCRTPPPFIAQRWGAASSGGRAGPGSASFRAGGRGDGWAGERGGRGGAESWQGRAPRPHHHGHPGEGGARGPSPYPPWAGGGRPRPDKLWRRRTCRAGTGHPSTCRPPPRPCTRPRRAALSPAGQRARGWHRGPPGTPASAPPTPRGTAHLDGQVVAGPAVVVLVQHLGDIAVVELVARQAGRPPLGTQRGQRRCPPAPSPPPAPSRPRRGADGAVCGGTAPASPGSPAPCSSASSAPSSCSWSARG